MSLEPAFWIGLKDAAAARDTSVAKLVTEIAQGEQANLSARLRVFVFEFYREQVRQRTEGHIERAA